MKLAIFLIAAVAAFGQAKDQFPRNLSNSTTLPAACRVGDIYFDNDATAGQNLYGCTAANTWTLQSGSVVGLFATNAQTSTYQVLAADFAACKTITVASGTFVITLVASGSQPADGQCITILNYGTGVVTLARSGQNINGAASNLTGTVGSATAPTGWRVYSNGTNYFAEVIGGGGGTYTASTGMVLTGNAFSVDSAVQLSRSTDQAGTDKTCTSSTGNDTYTCALTPSLTVYTTGMCIVLKAGTANTGAATLNIDTLGAKNILTRALATPANGDIPADIPTTLCYDGTQFVPDSGGGSGSSTMRLSKRWSFGSDGGGGFNPVWVDNFDSGVDTGTGAIGALVAHRTWSDSTLNTHFVVLLLPPNWDSTGAISLTARSWMGAGSGNVRWEFASKCYADGDDWASVASFNAAQQSTTLAFDGSNNTGSATLASLTKTGCAAGETLVIRIERDNAVGSNLAAAAGIVALEATYIVTVN